MVGAVLFIVGAALAPVVMLGLCGIPIALLGLVVMWAGLLLVGGGESGGEFRGVGGALALAAALGLVVWATGVALGPVAQWVIAEQRGGGTPWPMDAMAAMVAWSAGASLTAAGGVWARDMAPLGVGVVAGLYLMLPSATVGAFLLAQAVLRLPLTA